MCVWYERWLRNIRITEHDQLTTDTTIKKTVTLAEWRWRALSRGRVYYFRRSRSFIFVCTVHYPVDNVIICIAQYHNMYRSRPLYVLHIVHCPRWLYVSLKVIISTGQGRYSVATILDVLPLLSLCSSLVCVIYYNAMYIVSVYYSSEYTVFTLCFHYMM